MERAPAAPGAAVDDLLALPLTGVCDDDLLDLLRAVERRSRRLPTLDHAAVAEAESRDATCCTYPRPNRCDRDRAPPRGAHRGATRPPIGRGEQTVTV